MGPVGFTPFIETGECRFLTKVPISFMDQTHVGYSYWQQPMVNSMPSTTRVQTKKQALSGPLRIVPEGYRGAWVCPVSSSF
jgi:hypothetical protein